MTPPSATPEDGNRAWVAVRREDYEAAIMGSPEGLRRLGRILERCASDEPADREYRSCGAATEDLQQLMAADLPITGVQLLKRPPDRIPKGMADRFALVGWALVVLFVGGMCALGLGVLTGLIPTR